MTDDKLAYPTATTVALAASDADQSTAALLSAITRASTDPTVDPAKMTAMFELYRAVAADRARVAFSAAMARLQAKLPKIAKTGRIEANAHTRTFATIVDIHDAVKGLLAEEGFSFAFDSAPSGNQTLFTARLSHRDGHSESKSLSLPTDTGGGRNAVQSMGSTVSYARRYLLMMHLNLVMRDEDDDGSGGRHPITPEQAAEIHRLMTEAKADKARFLNWAAAASVEEIQAGNYKRCVEFLRQKAAGGGK